MDTLATPQCQLQRESVFRLTHPIVSTSFPELKS
jgi:hypothetical protein